MSQVRDQTGHVVTNVRIGKPYNINKFHTADPNDIKAVDHTSDNSLLTAIIENNYNGIVTISSGEKYEIKTVAKRGSKILLTQTKLHTQYQGRNVRLVPISARYVEITLAPIKFQSTDFPALK